MNTYIILRADGRARMTLRCPDGEQNLQLLEGERAELYDAAVHGALTPAATPFDAPSGLSENGAVTDVVTEIVGGASAD